MTTQASVVMDRMTGTATYEQGHSGIQFDPPKRDERVILAPMESVVIDTSARLMEIDFQSRCILSFGHEVKTTPIEFDLLRVLTMNSGKVLTHRVLLRQVWGPEYGEEREYLRVHLSHLRRKIEADIRIEDNTAILSSVDVKSLPRFDLTASLDYLPEVGGAAATWQTSGNDVMDDAEPMLNPPLYYVVDLTAYRILEQRAPQFLTKHFGRDLLDLLSLVLQRGHKPVLALDDEGTLELEVKVNPKEILLLSVTPEGMPDALVHNAQRGFESIASNDIAGVVRFLRESRKVSQVKAK